MSSKTLVSMAIAAVAGLVVGLGVLWFRDPNRRGKAEAGSNKDVVPTVPADSNVLLSKQDVVDILRDLEKAAIAAQNTIEAAVKQAESSHDVSTLAVSQSKADKVQVIVRAMAPVERARTLVCTKRDIGKGDLQQAIALYEEDLEVRRLNNSMENTHAEIARLTGVLLS
jgi:hypothetical protein